MILEEVSFKQKVHFLLIMGYIKLIVRRGQKGQEIKMNTIHFTGMKINVITGFRILYFSKLAMGKEQYID